MLVDHFPLLGLRITSGDLELRLPEPEELAALADVAAGGIHAPDEMPFLFPWTDQPGADRARSVVLHHWRRLGAWQPNDWGLPLTVFRDGEPVGVQDVKGEDFAVMREVYSGSWLGQRFHRQGIGTRMRAMMLHLAFAGLGAVAANTEAFDTNVASRGVTERNGYLPNGQQHVVVRGVKISEHKYRLERERWDRTRPTTPIEIHGLKPCLPLFGLDG